MTKRTWTTWTVAAIGLAVGVVGWHFAFLVAPLAWTGEPERLAAALGLEPGMRVADLGAGDGAMALAMARLVTANGRVYATELTEPQRNRIADRVRRQRVDHVEVRAAAETETLLPDACCDAVYLRHVFHHLGDPATYVASLTRAVRPGGRVAIIDFAPGALWHLGGGHGVTADRVRETFETAGWRQRERNDAWGGSTFLVVFERLAASK